MADAIAYSSRAAAERLVASLGPEIVMEVEDALRLRQGAVPTQYIDPVSVGGLIVSVASLAWTVLSDLRARKETVTPHVLARSVRLELDSMDISTQERDLIIDVVVTETIEEPRSGEGEPSP